MEWWLTWRRNGKAPWKWEAGRVEMPWPWPCFAVCQVILEELKQREGGGNATVCKTPIEPLRCRAGRQPTGRMLLLSGSG